MIWDGHRMIIFGFLPRIPEMMAVAVAFSMAWLEGGVELQLEDERSRDLSRSKIANGSGWR